MVEVVKLWTMVGEVEGMLYMKSFGFQILIPVVVPSYPCRLTNEWEFINHL